MTKKSKETTKTNKEMEEISEDLSNMHVDGFSHIFSKNSDKLVVKLVWLVLVISSAAACTFLVIKSVNEYLHYEVTTTSRVLTEHQSNIPGNYHLQFQSVHHGLRRLSVRTGKSHQ